MISSNSCGGVIAAGWEAVLVGTGQTKQREAHDWPALSWPDLRRPIAHLGILGFRVRSFLLAPRNDGPRNFPRHCEPTGRANARPMRGSAKQSIWRQTKCG